MSRQRWAALGLLVSFLAGCSWRSCAQTPEKAQDAANRMVKEVHLPPLVIRKQMIEAVRQLRVNAIIDFGEYWEDVDEAARPALSWRGIAVKTAMNSLLGGTMFEWSLYKGGPAIIIERCDPAKRAFRIYAPQKFPTPVHPPEGEGWAVSPDDLRPCVPIDAIGRAWHEMKFKDGSEGGFCHDGWFPRLPAVFNLAKSDDWICPRTRTPFESFEEIADEWLRRPDAVIFIEKPGERKAGDEHIKYICMSMGTQAVQVFEAPCAKLVNGLLDESKDAMATNTKGVRKWLCALELYRRGQYARQEVVDTFVSERFFQRYYEANPFDPERVKESGDYSDFIFHSVIYEVDEEFFLNAFIEIYRRLPADVQQQMVKRGAFNISNAWQKFRAFYEELAKSPEPTRSTYGKRKLRYLKEALEDDNGKEAEGKKD